jgi:hypothetical protein
VSDAEDTPTAYSVAQVAAVLGVTDRRVRQLVAEGRLPTVSTEPMTLEAAAVLDLRDARAGHSRRTTTAPEGRPPSPRVIALPLDELRELLNAERSDVLELLTAERAKRDELERAERERLTTELAKATAEAQTERLRAEQVAAERDALAAELERLRATQTAAAPTERRRWWGR